ncbi:AI-2E family transporter [Dethiothermospora halolimnae]|uniref:AI-2E family transporter n=1 Tax=Dethiothermospora halolimnae TaxID=3114390 RepID=UPI003CCC11D3
MIIINRKKYYFNLVPLIVIGIVLFKFIYTENSLGSFFNLITPFIWAFFVAYLLNPILVYLEEHFKIKRIWSILIVYIILVGLIVLIITIFTPKVVQSFKNLVQDIPDYFDATKKWLSSEPDKLQFLNRYGVIDYIRENIYDILDDVKTNITTMINSTISQVINFTSALLDFALGIIISIYILKDKELFKKQFKKLIYTMINKDKGTYYINLMSDLDKVFSKYLVGKIIDSIIIGILCFIGLLIINAPYALVFSTIVGITNMIPYFGPFIGMVPAVIITLFYSPIKAIWVGLFIFGLQQFDGLYLGPKILGTQVGLKPFWIISAIIVGGGLFGILGMLLAVPVAAMIKTILVKYIEKKDSMV